MTNPETSIESRVHILLPREVAVVSVVNPDNKRGHPSVHVIFNGDNALCRAYPPIPGLGSRFKAPRKGLSLISDSEIQDIDGSESSTPLTGMFNVIRCDKNGKFPDEPGYINNKQGGKLDISEPNEDGTKTVRWMDKEGNVLSSDSFSAEFVNFLAATDPRYLHRHWKVLCGAAGVITGLVVTAAILRAAEPSE